MCVCVCVCVCNGTFYTLYIYFWQYILWCITLMDCLKENKLWMWIIFPQHYVGDTRGLVSWETDGSHIYFHQQWHIPHRFKEVSFKSNNWEWKWSCVFGQVLPGVLKKHSAPSGSSSLNIKKYGTKNVCYIGMADVCSQWTPHLYLFVAWLLFLYCLTLKMRALILLNVRNYLPNDMMLHPRCLESSATLLWVPQIL